MKTVALSVLQVAAESHIRSRFFYELVHVWGCKDWLGKVPHGRVRMEVSLEGMTGNTSTTPSVCNNKGWLLVHIIEINVSLVWNFLSVVTCCVDFIIRFYLLFSINCGPQPF